MSSSLSHCLSVLSLQPWPNFTPSWSPTAHPTFHHLDNEVSTDLSSSSRPRAVIFNSRHRMRNAGECVIRTFKIISFLAWSLSPNSSHSIFGTNSYSRPLLPYICTYRCGHSLRHMPHLCQPWSTRSQHRVSTPFGKPPLPLATPPGVTPIPFAPSPWVLVTTRRTRTTPKILVPPSPPTRANFRANPLVDSLTWPHPLHRRRIMYALAALPLAPWASLPPAASTPSFPPSGIPRGPTPQMEYRRLCGNATVPTNSLAWPNATMIFPALGPFTSFPTPHPIEWPPMIAMYAPCVHRRRRHTRPASPSTVA